MNDTRFIINPNNNTVVAILPDMEDVTNEVAQKCKRLTAYAVWELIDKGYRCNQPELDIPYEAKFKGVAYCDKHDAFCENIGKDVSENKALKKYHSAMARKYSRLAELLKNAYEEMQALEACHIVKALNAEKSIEKYNSNNGFSSKDGEFCVNEGNEALLNNFKSEPIKKF